ncbi:MAG: DUF726 domain-containing protein [Halapricum sp.]
MSRRSVLKGAATGTIALTGTAAFSGTASAGSCLGLNGSEVPDSFPMIEDGSVSGDFPWSADELVIFVHGWMEELSGDASGQAYATKLALDQTSYSGEVAGFKYPSNAGWYTAKDLAEDHGRAFADWLSAYMNDHPGTTVRIVCHSLGARTSLACLDELQNRDESVTSLTLLGAAVPADSVTEYWWGEGDWNDAVEYGADEVDNFRSDNDSVLEYIYSLAEWGTEALGEQGAEGDEADNYEDHDVTDTVGDHCEYFQPDTGCMGDVVSEF